jgi:enamine deaminase RidA (YjgF/YER057c/UK114 family)
VGATPGLLKGCPDWGTVYVSGTVGVMADGSVPLDAYGQTKRSLEIIRGAVEQAGASMVDVVHTRIFVTDIHQFEEVARSHGEIFGTIRPATSGRSAAARGSCLLGGDRIGSHGVGLFSETAERKCSAHPRATIHGKRALITRWLFIDSQRK